jgi:hypothetical protein
LAQADRQLDRVPGMHVLFLPMPLHCCMVGMDSAAMTVCAIDQASGEL